MAYNILVGLRKMFTSGNKPVNYGALAFVLLFFFYINAKVVFASELAAGATRIIEVYIIGLLMAVALMGLKPDLFKQGTRSLMYFIIAFLGGLMLTLSVHFLFQGLTFGAWGVTQTSWALLQIFVIALVETLIFQSAIAGVFGRWGMVAAPVAFGIFHAAVYELSLPLIISAVAVGGLLQIVYNRWGVEATWGLHAAINIGLIMVAGGVL